MENAEFCFHFLQSTCEAVDMLKYYSKDCLSGDKFCCIESTCNSLRSMFRDSVKPAKRTICTISREADSSSWDISQTFPPVRSVIFSNEKII